MIKTIEHIVDEAASAFDMQGHEREFQTIATILIAILALSFMILVFINERGMRI